jgi:DNA-binding beta-propeller fold protein YncE
LLAPIAGVTPARLGFAPTDVALSPDGLTALVVGDGGFASVDLAVPTLPITTHSTVPARSIALTPDGARAVITRPAGGEVVVVNAARGSGTFGLPIATLALGGAPGGVAVAPDGTRAFVTDATGGMVRVLDIDPASVALYSERRQIPMPATALTGGVAVDPRGGTLVLTSSDRGLLAVDLSTDAVVVLNPAPNSGGVAIPPSGAEVLAPGGTLVASLITASLPDAISVPGQVILGGAPRDVAVHPQGRSALVVNSLFDELQVVDLDTNSGTYHQAVARVGTGRSPIAVAVSAAGGVVAVANYGDRTLSIYSTQGADASLRRVIPDVASPGTWSGSRPRTTPTTAAPRRISATACSRIERHGCRRASRSRSHLHSSARRP